MKYSILIMLGLFLASCAQVQEQESEAMVYAAGIARYETPSDPHSSEAYNLSVGHWEKDTIRYVIKDYPENLISQADNYSKQGFRDTVHLALSIWSEHTGKIFKYVETGDYEIFITIKKGDGLGGELARAWFPPLPNSIIKSVELRFDYWDVATLEGRTVFDFFQLRFTREDTTSALGIVIKNQQFYIGLTSHNENYTSMTYSPLE